MHPAVCAAAFGLMIAPAVRARAQGASGVRLPTAGRVAPKRPALGGVLSLVVPGAGQA